MSQLRVNSISDAAGANGNAISLVTDGSCTAKVTNNLSNRNLIINGAMTVAQRSVAAVTDDGFKTVDRFKLVYEGSDNHLTQEQRDISHASEGTVWAAGFRKAFKITNGNQTSGAGAGDEASIRYAIEAQDISYSGWDFEDSNSKITLSFWAKASVAQTYQFTLYTQDGPDMGWTSEFALSANTWTKITKVIPGHSSLEFHTNVGLGMEIKWYAFIGTTYTDSGATTDAWGTWDNGSTRKDMTSTWWTTDDATFDITGVQLEVSDYATDFEHRKFQDELYNCQRYYQQVGTTTQDGQFCLGASHLTSAGDQTRVGYFGQNNLRATPTITEFGDGLRVIGSGSKTPVTGISDINVTFPSAYLQFNAECTDIGDDNEIVVVTNTANGGIKIEAEL